MFFKLHNYKSILGHNLHYIGTAALGVGAIALAQPWMLMLGAAVATSYVVPQILSAQNFVKTYKKKHPDRHRFSPNLKQIISRLYKASGLNIKESSLYDCGSDVPNAGSINFGETMIMASDPLLELLNDEEEEAVFAHELTHAAAKHQYIEAPHELLSAISKVSSSIATLAEAVSTNGAGMAISLSAVLALNIAIKKHHPNGYLLSKQYQNHAKETFTKGNHLKYIHESHKMKKLTNGLSKATVIGTLSVFNPTLLPVYAAAKGISLTANYLENSFSRSMEYQADRGATVLGANPLALITALRKISAVQERSLKKAWANHGVPTSSPLEKAWKQQFLTHPTVERRIKRLVTIAKEKGFSREDIERATTDLLIIPDTVNIPHEYIMEMAKSLIGRSAYEGSNDNDTIKRQPFKQKANLNTALPKQQNIIGNHI